MSLNITRTHTAILATILSLGNLGIGRAIAQTPARPYVEVVIYRSGGLDQSRCALSVTPTPNSSTATDTRRAASTPYESSDPAVAAYALESLGAPVEVTPIPRFKVALTAVTRCFSGSRLVNGLRIPIFENVTSSRDLTLADSESMDFTIRPEGQDETFKVTVTLRR
jgi:hypothetical protein